MAHLTKPQRAERARILRELLLLPALRRRDNPSTEYTAALEDLTDDLVVTDNGGVLSVNTADMMGRADDHRHDTIAAARLVMGALETAPGRASTTAHLSANLAHRSFPAPMVSAALAWLVEQGLITVTGGVVTDITGDRRPKAPRPALPADMVTPRNTAPAPAPSTAAPVRPRMDADERMMGTTDPMAMGARMREQATMPSAGFDPGDVPAAAAKTTVEKTPAAPTIPDSAIVAYTAAVLDMWARHGKPSGEWAEFPWDLPTIDLPDGITPSGVVHRVFDRLIKSGIVRKDDELFTYVPAQRAVTAVAAWLTRFIGNLSFDVHTRADFHRDASTEAKRVAPDGWTATIIIDLALLALVSDGTLTVDGDVFTRVVEPAPEVVAPAPAGRDTTSSTPKTEQSGTVQRAPKTEGKVVEKSAAVAPAPVAAAKPAPAPAPTPVSAALEKKVDTLTTKVDGIAARLGTLPPPPSKTATIIAAAREADIDVVVCLEDVLVALYVHDEAPRSVIRDRLPGRVRSKSTGRIRDRRSKLGAALALGTRAGVIAIDDDGKKYRYITHADVLDKHAWKARLDRRLGTAA